MKCRYRFPAVGRFKIEVGICIKVGDYVYELEVENERLKFVSVTVENFPTEFLPRIEPLVNKFTKAHIIIPENPFRPEIVANIRALEGGLSLWEVDEINTEQPTIEWIPENKEDEAKMTLSSFTRSRSKDDEDFDDAQLNLIARTIAGLSGLLPHELPLNFFRRGKADLREGRFIDAMYDFFFVLETLFANGKFHKAAVIDEFRNSDELVSAIQYVKTEARDPIYSPPDLRKDFVEKLETRSVEEIITYLVETRGFLHHHTEKRRGIWHPANQREYRLDCIILVNICQCVLSKRVLGHLFDKQVFAEFLSKEVTTLDGTVFNWTYPGESSDADAAQTNPNLETL